MNICFFVKRYYTNKDLFTDKFGRLYYMPVELEKLGCTCTIFALDFKNRQIQKFNHEGINFENIPILSFKIFKGLGDLLRYKRSNVDIVIASGDIYIGLLGYWLAKYFQAISIFDLYDNYLSFKSNKKIPFMKKLFHFVLQKNDFLFFASASLRKKYRDVTHKSLVFENSVDKNVFYPVDTSDARKASKLDDSALLIGYFGMLRKRRGINELFAAMEKVRKIHPDAKLLLSGAKDDDIDISPDWITYKGNVSQKQVNLFINACCLIFC